MRPQFIRKAMDQYARRQIGRRDLWPAIRQSAAPHQPLREGIHVEAAGSRPALILQAGLLIGIVVAALLLAPLLSQLGATATGQHASGAAAAVAQATATAAPAADKPATGATTKAADKPATGATTKAGSDYSALMTSNMAAQLGITTDQLNAAFSAAAAQTLDKAVSDGVIDAEQAKDLKAQATDGVGLSFGALMKQGFAGQKPDAEFDEHAVITAVAQLFKMNNDQLMEAIKGGQTLTSLEQANSVTHQQVLDAAIAAARTSLQEGVTKGKWTQADADRVAPNLAVNVNSLLDKLSGGGGQSDSTLDSAIGKAIEDAVAGALGMEPGAYMTALKGGASLTSLEQAHNVTHDKVRAAALTAAQQALQGGVTAGNWTQADADAYAKDLESILDKMLGKMAGDVPADGATK